MRRFRAHANRPERSSSRPDGDGHPAMQAIKDQLVQGLELRLYEDGSFKQVSLVAGFVVSFHVSNFGYPASLAAWSGSIDRCHGWLLDVADRSPYAPC